LYHVNGASELRRYGNVAIDAHKDQKIGILYMGDNRELMIGLYNKYTLRNG